MAKLRLFAQAREAAGTKLVQMPGATVGDVLDAAVQIYGNDFGVVLGQSNVWLNGEPVNRDQNVTDADEVAVLPPVSGG